MEKGRKEKIRKKETNVRDRQGKNEKGIKGKSSKIEERLTSKKGKSVWRKVERYTELESKRKKNVHY